MSPTASSEDGLARAGRAPTKRILAERLEMELLSGNLPAGTKLESERALAQRFGVSRPMVREVLHGLEQRGLIEVAPGRGAFVRDVRVTDVVRPVDALYRQRRPTPRDVIHARLMLERETAALAARHATEEDLLALDVSLTRFDAARDVVSRARADIDFHATIARAAHSQVIEIMFSSIAGLTFELMLRSLGDPSVVREGVPYHREILCAIRARDPEAAAAAMTGHLDVALRTYGDDLDKSLDLVAQRSIEQLMGLSGD
ncbi:FadR/GntR family transcriptional regulator [Streptomyces sp. NPDC058576]|uniref:FadR/GntR family transcriptional regulator n=1 Tax=Streptomyces sp. NPDC058576 TaxID=3346547 RepID=UPI003648595C